MKFVFFRNGNIQLVDQRQQFLTKEESMEPVGNAAVPFDDIARAERILWLSAAGEVWLVKDRFTTGRLPRNLEEPTREKKTRTNPFIKVVTDKRDKSVIASGQRRLMEDGDRSRPYTVLKQGVGPYRVCWYVKLDDCSSELLWSTSIIAGDELL